MLTNHHVTTSNAIRIVIRERGFLNANNLIPPKLMENLIDFPADKCSRIVGRNAKIRTHLLRWNQCHSRHAVAELPFDPKSIEMEVLNL